MAEGAGDGGELIVGDMLLQVVEDDEVVSGAVHFGEAQKKTSFRKADCIRREGTIPIIIKYTENSSIVNPVLCEKYCKLCGIETGGQGGSCRRKENCKKRRKK